MIEKILLVDDHPMVLTSLTQTLQEAGYEVTTAGNISQALDKLSNTEPPFDLLLLDYNLADEKGDDLFSKSTFQRPEIVAILSGMTDPNTICSALKRCSANAFIAKNISLTNLPLALRVLSARVRSRRGSPGSRGQVERPRACQEPGRAESVTLGGRAC